VGVADGEGERAAGIEEGVDLLEGSRPKASSKVVETRQSRQKNMAPQVKRRRKGFFSAHPATLRFIFGLL